MLTPVAMDLDAAPVDLLKIVQCKHKIETYKPCSSSLCSCCKQGLQCVASCKNRCGTSCGTASSITYVSSEDETDSDRECDVQLYEDPGDDLSEEYMEYSCHGWMRKSLEMTTNTCCHAAIICSYSIIYCITISIQL